MSRVTIVVLLLVFALHASVQEVCLETLLVGGRCRERNVPADSSWERYDEEVCI